MRFVVYGAGAIGGVVGARLAQHGHDVVLIARGAHFEAIRSHGLRFETPDECLTLQIPVVDSPARIAWTSRDVVLLAVKSQDTTSALDQLAAAAPPSVPLACVQNGVANERMALRRFANVYGVFVYSPTVYLAPGTVQNWYVGQSGILDIGRYPSGSDATADLVAAAFRDATFFSKSRPDVMRWKYRKLLMNLANAVEALCGSASRGNIVVSRAVDEGEACLKAAGIDVVGRNEPDTERERQLTMGSVGGLDRPGGSSWQSLARHALTIEADYLNGEIVLLGHLHGIPTPVNELLQQLANRAAREGKPPGSLTLDELEALVAAPSESR
jgi:2-dehydropantoate 2-reductase